MKTEEIAKCIVDWCNDGRWYECYQKLYSMDLVSIEPEGIENNVANGMMEVAEKGQRWMEAVHVHSSVASDPVVAGDWFTVKFTMDATHLGSGQRRTSSEIAVYQVADGKIVKEQFFYNIPPEI